METIKRTYIKVGLSYIFRYPEGFVTLPEYSEHRDQPVTIIRQLTADETDQGEGMERMFEFGCGDGFIGHAFESELEKI